MIEKFEKTFHMVLLATDCYYSIKEMHSQQFGINSMLHEIWKKKKITF